MPYLAKIILYTSVFCNAIPLLAGFYLFRYLKIEMKLFLSLFVLIVLVEGLSMYEVLSASSNLYILHFYTLFEYIILVLVFSFWQKNNVIKKILRYSIPFYFLTWLLLKIFIEDLDQFDEFSSSLTSMLLTIIALTTLFSYMKYHIGSLKNEAWFWISIGVLIYNTGNILIFTFYVTSLSWAVHNVLGIISTLCYTGGFVSQRR